MAALVIAAGVLALPTLLLDSNPSENYLAIAGGLFLAVGLLYATRVAPWYLGSRLQMFFLGLPWLVAFMIAGQLWRAFPAPANEVGNTLALAVIPAVLLASMLYLSPTLVSFTRTVLQGGWALLAAGVGMLCAGSIASSLANGDSETYANAIILLAFGVFASGLYRIHRGLLTLRPESREGPSTEAVSDTERLNSAIRYLVEGTLEQFVQVHGRRALRALEKQFNTSSAGEGSGFSIINGRVQVTGEGSLLERSQAYATALTNVFSVNARLAGNRFVNSQLRGC